MLTKDILYNRISLKGTIKHSQEVGNMIIIKGCTPDVIDDISEFIGSLSIDDVNVYFIGDDH